MRAYALILAAGQGRRFGGAKLHALYRKRPLLSYVLDVAEAARERGLVDGGHVVVGGEDDEARDLVRHSGLNAIINDTPELGLSGSLRLGVAALEARAAHERDAAVVFLGDQPLVRLDVVERLIARWRQGGAAIIRPRYQDQPAVPGHPVLLTRSVWPAAEHLQGDEGFGSLLHSAAPEAVTLNVPGGNPDVDTRADLLGLEESPE
jgi:molybdenum cofactor cytidylyltransferase